jgi:DNA-directed RNA polymerase subunit RPC12/RpoP
MVYCSKCGTQNSDSNIYCSNCGSPITPTVQPKETRYERRMHGHMERQQRHSTGYIGLFVGTIIILIGIFSLLEIYYSFDFPWWPIIIIAVGLFLISRWLTFKAKGKMKSALPFFLIYFHGSFGAHTKELYHFTLEVVA